LLGDGRFLMTRAADGVAPRPDALILVENVFEEMKAMSNAQHRPCLRFAIS
jgi:hypothetical protein